MQYDPILEAQSTSSEPPPSPREAKEVVATMNNCCSTARKQKPPLLVKDMEGPCHGLRHRPGASRFHIHVDADRLSGSLEAKLKAAGYAESDFLRHDGGEPRPRFIRTLKLDDGRTYKIALQEVTEVCKADDSFIGFVEGEVICARESIIEKEYDPSVPIPFRVSARREPGGFTKTADMHVTLCPLESHPQLIERLFCMGFSLVLAPKPSGLMAVFSLQGTRETIGCLFKATCEYLRAAGGAAQCSTKDERITWLWVSGADAPATRVITKVI
ncbi:hypothetical protein [Candidatus Thiosymbion oneisti]|uniref:hypothetical protein n=1 Tax=Candidatus Thiosymbion oneisti TaxID=589554 RepID=UPI000B7FBB69|nr:hypothetical protein [Candidatus Thiosymbion oneisti]